jgi:hypothetical protein
MGKIPWGGGKTFPNITGSRELLFFPKRRKLKNWQNFNF